jgi:hypothetical protein
MTDPAALLLWTDKTGSGISSITTYDCHNRQQSQAKIVTALYPCLAQQVVDCQELLFITDVAGSRSF